ncbi:putative phosphoinositide 3-kinase [Trichodelitschia bisporula]|uniref:Phosphatidylinositol 3-kinase VPS34 n=1 Tax=Trichodelitschia bisporula TaxID=703511 RepID=A0A6G1HXA0_9PEZI|nr:putative phosphoinositide 3-kinase [Trichodelitschia bisporula]
MESFSFASSSALKIPVSVKINSLDGFQKPIPFSTLIEHPELRYKGSNQSPHSELYVTARLWADSKPLTVPVQTAYKVFKNSRTWGEWLTLPINYANVPLDSLLALTVWDLSPAGGEGSHFHAVPFGGTTIPLFDKDNTLHKGRQRCRLHRHRAADGLSSSTTPHVISAKKQRGSKSITEQLDARAAEMERLETLMKKHEMGEIPENKWLDQLVFRQIEKLQRGSFKNKVLFPAENGANGGGDNEATNNEADDGIFYLYIEFPRFDHPIVFTDHEYPAPPLSSVATASSSDVRLKPPPEVSFGPGIGEGYGDASIGRLVRIYDPEVGMRDNPAENKHRRLVRSHRTGVLDRDLKPNAKIRDELNLLVSYGPLHELNPEEKDLIWKFRHYLTRDKHALTKFVRSVSWSDQSEARQAVQVLAKWTEIDVDDALELLGPTFNNPAVRAFAVQRLHKSDDDELLLYLLQLVQALKFERPPDEDPAATDSSLATFLIKRAAANFTLGNYLHWYLMVECDDRTPQQDPASRKLFAKVEFDFMAELERQPGGPEYRKTLLRQGELVAVLTKLSRDIATSREDRPRKIERLKRFIAEPKNELLSFDPLPLPLDPSVQITGITPDEANVFKSSLLPLLLNFKTSTGRTYPVIFKTGDDLRQDQLVIQIITLMDRLLRKENLDLKLTPFRVLATAPHAGAMQFVPSASLSAALTKHKTLLAYLKHHNPDESAPLGVRKEVMETYVKSCAGYCVITYLLGVGDRHLDNLLLAPSGHFFHADFGYILGRDPKPFAPLMKLAREMVEGMGGAGHAYYALFKQHCYTAYASLRKSANLILNLFALMSEANIPDIRIEPDKVVLKVQERFHLDLSEEEAIRGFEALIADSVSAVMPVVIDRLHGFVQGWRA